MQFVTYAYTEDGNSCIMLWAEGNNVRAEFYTVDGAEVLAEGAKATALNAFNAKKPVFNEAMQARFDDWNAGRPLQVAAAPAEAPAEEAPAEEKPEAKGMFTAFGS